MSQAKFQTGAQGLSVEKKEAPQYRLSKKRILLRFFAAFFSLIFFISAFGLLYVEGLMDMIVRPSENNPVSQTLSAPESSLGVNSDYYDPADVSSGMTASEAREITQNKFRRHKAGFDAVQKIAPLNDSHIYNVLLIGTDLGGIGDTTILVSLNKSTGKIHLTSFMRAMYVNIPQYGWFMLNHAYSWGGPALVAATIEQNFRVDVDDYIVVDFNSFSRVVDAVGGVTVNLTAAEADYLVNRCDKSRTLTAGLQHLDGAAALDYVRIRKIDSDFKRTERQRNVITALINQAANSSLARLNSLATTVAAMVKTNLSNNDLLALVAKSGTYSKYPISQKMIPFENDTSNGGASAYNGITHVPYYSNPAISVEVYLFDFEQNVSRIHDFIRS